MTKVVYKFNSKGTLSYIGYVPDEYELRDGEHFYPLNDDGGKDE